MKTLAFCLLLCALAFSAGADPTGGPLFPASPPISISNVAPFELKDDPTKVRVGIEFRGDKAPLIAAAMREEIKSNPSLVLRDPHLEQIDYLVVVAFIPVKAGAVTNGYAIYMMCAVPIVLAQFADQLPEKLVTKDREVLTSSTVINWSRGAIKVIGDGYGFTSMHALTHGTNGPWLKSFDQNFFEPTVRFRSGLTKP